VELRGVRLENVNATELAALMASAGGGGAAMAMAMAARPEEALRAMSVALELGLELSVYNPNRASFSYGSSRTEVFYREMRVGEAAIPAGRIGARAWESLATSLALNASAEALLRRPEQLAADVAAGSFPMSAAARLCGRLRFLRLFSRRARSSTRCTMSVSLARRAVQNLLCTYRLHL
jgi:hypothetical protein